MMRWERVRVPFPIVRGVKRAEELPRGASSAESLPFPGRVAVSGEILEGDRRIEPILAERR